MNLMYKIQIIIFSILMLSVGSLYAGNQGVSAYYGIGLGGSLIKDTVPSMDVAPTGGIVAGIEEDGWAIEYGLFKSTETGTDDPAIDYTLSGVQTSLSYRTVERGSVYYKIRYGSSDVDLEVSNSVTTELSGNIWGLAMGFRMARDERLEIEYGVFVPSDDTVNNTHMLMFNYLFGGPSSGGRR